MVTLDYLYSKVCELERKLISSTVVNIVGHSKHNTSSGVVFSPSDMCILGKIASHTQESGKNIWTYEVTPIRINDFNDVDEAGDNYIAVNLREIENPSDGTGLHGNGVDNSAASWPANMDIQPCPIGSIVQLWPLLTFTGVQKYFIHDNGVDGEC